MENQKIINLLDKDDTDPNILLILLMALTFCT